MGGTVYSTRFTRKLSFHFCHDVSVAVYSFSVDTFQVVVLSNVVDMVKSIPVDVKFELPL